MLPLSAEDVEHEDAMGVPVDDDCEEFEILGEEEQVSQEHEQQSHDSLE